MQTTIFTGSILNSPSNTYLISIWEDRILKWAVAKLVLETFGEEIQEILLTQSYFEKWEARLIKTWWKNLIFARPFDYDFKLLTILWIEWCIKSALKICEENWFENISMIVNNSVFSNFESFSNSFHGTKIVKIGERPTAFDKLI